MFLQKHLSLTLLLALYLLTAGAYSVINPLFESPDEVWHYEYIRWLVEGHGLPRPEDVGSAPWHQEGSQPPLYYLSAAALTAVVPTDNAADAIRYNPHAAIGQPDAFGNKNMMAHGQFDSWPWRGVVLAAHLARFFSVLLGAVTVISTYGAARITFANPPTALLAAALVAFSPQFLFLSASINNDNLVTACCTAGLWLCLYLLQRRDPHLPAQVASPTVQHLLLLGLLAGAAALSKLSGLMFCGLVALTLFYIGWRRSTLWGVVRWGALSGGTALLVAGWWFIRNWLLFDDPLALTAMFDILPRRPEPPTWAELQARAQGVWRSYWAVFGWFNVVAADWFYHVYTALSLIGLLGFILSRPLRWLHNMRSKDECSKTSNFNPQIVLLLIWVGVTLLSLWQWAQMRYPQGRLLFPATGAFALLLAYGLTNWLPARIQRGASWLIGALLLGMAMLAPVRWIAPTYAATPSHSPNEIAVPTDIEFGSQLRLLGYRLGASELHPGDALPLTLYWQADAPVAQDYSIFVHLTDENNILQAQRDSFPDKGNRPTSQWRSGTLVLDPHLVTVPQTAPSPARLRVDVGVYDYATNTRLPVGDGDFWTLGYISLLPQVSEGAYPNSLFVNFDEVIALVGFEFDRRTMRPGETLTLTLWWEALMAPPIDYKVFTHLVLPPEATWAQMDSDPQRGAAKTSSWQPGQQIEDRYELTLPESAPAGVYFVEIGLYDPDTNDRLKVNFSDKGVVLGQVRVEE